MRDVFLRLMEKCVFFYFAIVKIRPGLTVLRFGNFYIVDKEKFPYDRGDISFEMKLFD